MRNTKFFIKILKYTKIFYFTDVLKILTTNIVISIEHSLSSFYTNAMPGGWAAYRRWATLCNYFDAESQNNTEQDKLKTTITTLHDKKKLFENDELRNVMFCNAPREKVQRTYVARPVLYKYHHD